MDGDPRSSAGGERPDRRWGSILGDRRQRRILATLLERRQPTSIETLVDRIAAESAASVDRRSIRLDLRHRCLPKLAAVGWIDRRSDDVTLVASPDLEVEGLSLPDLLDPEHPDWTATSVLLGRPVRQAVVAVLAGRGEPLSLTELIEALETTGQRSEDRSLLVALHHVHLPELEAVDLVTYDPEERTVAPGPRLPAVADRLDQDRVT